MLTLVLPDLGTLGWNFGFMDLGFKDLGFRV